MSSTEKRDALAWELSRKLPEAEQMVDGVIAEALRNAAIRLEALAASYALTGSPTAAWDAAIGRAFAASLEADAAALENKTERTEN